MRLRIRDGDGQCIQEPQNDAPRLRSLSGSPRDETATTSLFSCATSLRFLLRDDLRQHWLCCSTLLACAGSGRFAHAIEAVIKKHFDQLCTQLLINNRQNCGARLLCCGGAYTWCHIGERAHHQAHASQKLDTDLCRMAIRTTDARFSQLLCEHS